MEIVELIVTSFYLIIPAYFANMAPVIFAKAGWLKFLDLPIDGGKTMGNERLFGSGKTWRGLVSAIILGILIAGIQAFLYQYETFKNISLFDYPSNYLWFGFLAGLGAILGDLVKSFFKRRLNIASGRPWIIFDQLDFVAGFFIFTWIVVQTDWTIVATVCLITVILHPLTNISAYFLHLKKVWW